jgi:uncharacterized protein YndB with AHSA1/START domain
MTTTRRIVKASEEGVWQVLADGWLYPVWVVGASRMRAVEASWPARGSRIHHSVGTWPLLIDDHTEVTACKPGTLLALRARAWPAGEASVTIRLRPVDGGTEVSIEERVIAGPGRLIPDALEAAALRWRNRETLLRLAFVAEGRSSW